MNNVLLLTSDTKSASTVYMDRAYIGAGVVP